MFRPRPLVISIFGTGGAIPASYLIGTNCSFLPENSSWKRWISPGHPILKCQENKNNFLIYLDFQSNKGNIDENSILFKVVDVNDGNKVKFIPNLNLGGAKREMIEK